MGMILVFGIPIIAILTAHQRKMAELIHGQNRGNQADPMVQRQLDMMQSQIGELRGMMQELIITSDGPALQTQVPPIPASLEERLNT